LLGIIFILSDKFPYWRQDKRRFGALEKCLFDVLAHFIPKAGHGECSVPRKMLCEAVAEFSLSGKYIVLTGE
jgi:hypothetical protein